MKKRILSLLVIIVMISVLIPSFVNNVTADTTPQSYLATWTDGEGGSYQKNFQAGEVIIIPTNDIFKDTFRKGGYTLVSWQNYTEGMTMPASPITFTAVYTPNDYTVSFDANGGQAIDPITVTFDSKYGRLPSSAVTGLSGGDSNWYLIDQFGTVTDTKITKLSKVTEYRNHTLFVKRKVLAPTVSIALSVPGGISDNYQYYIPDNSTRILTANIGNQNTDVLDYTYQWYKDGTLIENEADSTLTLMGNVSDSGKYKVVVTATLKSNSDIVVTSNSATAEKEQQVKILHAANTLSYDANGGDGGPSSNYTGGVTATVSGDKPTRENYIFEGWNTAQDGSGESYAGNDTYTFQNDNGNGGCVVTLYAQWKGEDRTVTYIVDGEIYKTETVEYGKDAVLPEVPFKEGYTGNWNHEGKNITANTEITAIYTPVPVQTPNDTTEPDDTAHPNNTTPPEDTSEPEGTPDANDNNTQDKSPQAVLSPQTEDSSITWLWIVLMLLSSAIITAHIIKHKIKQ